MRIDRVYPAVGLMTPTILLLIMTRPAIPQDDKAAAQFRQFDRNGDDRLTESEFVAGRGIEQPSAEREFRVFDVDGDKGLDLAEFRNNPLLIEAEDRGPLIDPLVDRAARLAEKLADSWGTWDTDGDGSLSAAEFSGSAICTSEPGLDTTKFADWDRNGDGRLTLDECRFAAEVAWGVRRPQGDPLRTRDGRSVNWAGWKQIDRDRDDSLSMEECRQFGWDREQTDTVFHESDSDGDGKISFAEWTATPRRTSGVVWDFLRIDTDRDGLVSREELRAGVGDWQRGLARHVIPAFDDNGDGKLSLYEYLATPLASLQRLWHNARPDSNHNGRLEFDEFRWGHGLDAAAMEADVFRRLDRNHDGVLDVDEFFYQSDAIPPERLLVRWDEDADGRLSETEFVRQAGLSAALAKRDFHLFDFNHDGFLQVEEFQCLPHLFPADRRGRIPGDPLDSIVDAYMAKLEQQWPDWGETTQGAPSVAEFGIAWEEKSGVPVHNALLREGQDKEYHVTFAVGSDSGSTFRVMKVDQNRDGVVEHVEARRLVEMLTGIRRYTGEPIRERNGRVNNWMHFRYIDQNQNDGLDRTEWDERSITGERSEALFTAGDKDQDGEISFSEWCAMATPSQQDPIAEFRNFDADLDGLVDPQELQTRVPEYKRGFARFIFPGFDTDQDGKLSLAEYRLTPVANQVLTWHRLLVDPNNDGKLTFDEFDWDKGQFPVLRYEYFRRLDLDRNGTLEPEEWDFRTRHPDTFYIVNGDGTGWRKLFQLEGYQACGSPVVSPDGKSIYFDAWKVGENNRQATTPAIFAVNLDGTNPHELTAGQMPSWSPDGQFLVCTRFSNPYGIWMLTADGKDYKYIKPGIGAEWSPDGSKIIFNDARAALFVYDTASGEFDEVLGGAVNPYQRVLWNFTWSPDSQQVCFKGVRPDATEEIVVLSAKGAELGFKVRYSGKGINADFAWHPQGDRLVFSMRCPERGRTQLYELAPNGDGPPILMPGQDERLNQTDVCWTPDGRQLIIVSGDY